VWCAQRGGGVAIVPCGRKKHDPGDSSWNMNSLLSAPMRRWSSSAWRFIFFSHRFISFLSGNAMPYTRYNTKRAQHKTVCEVDAIKTQLGREWSEAAVVSDARSVDTAMQNGILCQAGSDSSYHKQYLPPHVEHTHATDASEIAQVERLTNLQGVVVGVTHPIRS